MKMSIADKLMGKGPKVEEKKIIEFIKPVHESNKKNFMEWQAVVLEHQNLA